MLLLLMMMEPARCWPFPKRGQGMGVCSNHSPSGTTVCQAKPKLTMVLA